MSNRDNILNKIRAILAKTVDNGCTEDEAMVALETAEKLMNEHEISEDDLKIEDETAIIDSMMVSRDPYWISFKLAYFIGKFTETKAFGHKKHIRYAGLRSDVDFALWLTHTLTKFVQKELKSFMWGNGYQSLDPSRKRKVINGFIIGCVSRINSRMKEMIDARKTVTNSTALVVAKNVLIAEAMKDINLAPSDNRGRKAQGYSSAAEAGRNSGDNASFGRPIGKGGILMLTKG